MNKLKKQSFYLLGGLLLGISQLANAAPASVLQCSIESDDVYIEGQKQPLQFRMAQAAIRVRIGIGGLAATVKIYEDYTLKNQIGEISADTFGDGTLGNAGFRINGPLIQDAPKYRNAENQPYRATINFYPFKHTYDYRSQPMFQGYIDHIYEILDQEQEEVIYRESHDMRATCWDPTKL